MGNYDQSAWFHVFLVMNASASGSETGWHVGAGVHHVTAMHVTVTRRLLPRDRLTPVTGEGKSS